jgi:NADH dehydrogenase FAD-containing subunit
LGRRASHAITLVDRKMIHMWKPLFHEVASQQAAHLARACATDAHRPGVASVPLL